MVQNEKASWEEKKENLLSISDSAEFVGISVDTLRRWENKGRIEAHRSPGGHRYFDKDDLRELFGKKYTRIEVGEETEETAEPEKEKQDLKEQKKDLQDQDSELDEPADQSEDTDDPEHISDLSKDDEPEQDKQEEKAPNGERKRPKVIIPPTTPVRIKDRQLTSMRELDMNFSGTSPVASSQAVQEPPQKNKQTKKESGPEKKASSTQQKSVLDPKAKTEMGIKKFEPLEKPQSNNTSRDQKVKTKKEVSKSKRSSYIKIGVVVTITILALAFAIFSLARLRSSAPVISPVP